MPFGVLSSRSEQIDGWRQLLQGHYGCSLTKLVLACVFGGGQPAPAALNSRNNVRSMEDKIHLLLEEDSS